MVIYGHALPWISMDISQYSTLIYPLVNNHKNICINIYVYIYIIWNITMLLAQRSPHLLPPPPWAAAASPPWRRRPRAPRAVSRRETGDEDGVDVIRFAKDDL